VRGILQSILGGIGFATIFFLPLGAAGRIDQAHMMWTTRHTLEVAVAWIGLSSLAALALAWVTRVVNPRRQALLLLALATPSALSIVAVLGRSGVLSVDSTDYLRSSLVVVLAAALLCCVVLWFAAPAALSRVIRGAAAVGCVMVVPQAITIAALTPHSAGAQPAGVVRAAQHAVASASREHVIVVLFDELSYGAIFSNGQPTIPSLIRRAANARIYHHAMAPTTSTDSSVDAYIGVSSTGGAATGIAEGVIGRTKSQGFETEAVGWYYPYCSKAGAYFDRCRGYSMYNAATLYDFFNPLAPIETVLNIWPYQWPTGVLKRPMAVWLHAAELAAITEDASAPLPSAPTFRWVHVNSPHVPFLEGSGPLGLYAFQRSGERYFRQIVNIDRVLERIFGALEQHPAGRPATVVILADHGYREGDAGDPLHVPLVMWRAGGTREDVQQEVRVVDELRVLVDAAVRK
jgi:hypothetical protein